VRVPVVTGMMLALLVRTERFSLPRRGTGNFVALSALERVARSSLTASGGTGVGASLAAGAVEFVVGDVVLVAVLATGVGCSVSSGTPSAMALASFALGVKGGRDCDWRVAGGWRLRRTTSKSRMATNDNLFRGMTMQIQGGDCPVEEYRLGRNVLGTLWGLEAGNWWVQEGKLRG